MKMRAGYRDVCRLSLECAPPDVDHHPRDDHLYFIISVNSRGCRPQQSMTGQTHRVPDSSLHEQNRLLKPRKRTQVNRRKSADGPRAKTHEKRIDVRDVCRTIRSVENAGKDKGCERATCADKKVVSQGDNNVDERQSV